MTETPTPPPPPRSLGATYGSLLLAWLIPGLGHVLNRDVRRGILLFAVIQVTFVIGLLLKGAVLWPVISPADWGFSAVNILTFVVQLGSGLAGLICLAMGQNFPEWATATRAHHLFELGTIYVLMAGAMNFFTVGGLYDRHLRRGRREAPQAL